MPSIGEFFVKLFVDASAGQVTVRDLVTKFGDLEAATLGEGAALLGVAAGLAQVADMAMDAAVGFQRFEAVTGLSSQELQHWQIVAAQANVSAQAVGASVTALQRNLANIAIGQGNISPFLMLGVDPTKDAFSVLAQLRERVRGVNPALAANLLQQMGIDPAMVQVLRLGNAEFTEFLATARGLSTPQARGFIEMRREIVQMGLQLRDLGYAAGLALKPLVDDLFAAVHGIRSLNLSVPALAATFGVLLAMFAPLTAAVAGLLLILEDLATYASGGKSLFGMIEEKFMGEKSGDTLKFWKDFGARAQKSMEDFAEAHGQAGAMLRNSTPYMYQQSGGNNVRTNHVNIHVDGRVGRPQETAEAIRDAFNTADRMQGP